MVGESGTATYLTTGEPVLVFTCCVSDDAKTVEKEVVKVRCGRCKRCGEWATDLDRHEKNCRGKWA
jgi:hypothetical protein